MKKTVNWGIIGLGKIAHKFAEGLNYVDDAKLYAVASRDQNNADAFAKKHQAEKAYGSYNDIIQDENVDVIYIATPHSFHHQITLDCLNNGKAVLCEKAFAMNYREAQEMVVLSRSRKIFLMEALWTRFLPHFKYILEKVKTGDLGEIISLKADFGFPAEYDTSKRLFNKSLGGGSLLDIGIYPVFMAYSVLGNPESIDAKATFTETGVDATCDIKFKYSNGVNADLYSTFLEKTPTTAEIVFERGTIILNSRFHVPTSITIISNGAEVTKEFDVKTNGYNFEAAHVTKMLQEGKTESDVWSLDNSLDLMSLLDRVRGEIGLEY